MSCLQRFNVLTVLTLLAAAASAQTCTLSCADDCVVDGNDVTCYNSGYSPDINGCGLVSCQEIEACDSSAVSDSEALTCTAKDACNAMDITNVQSVQCLAERACKYAEMSEIPAGGEIVCDSGDDDSDACNSASFTSMDHFTLWCDGSDCGNAEVTNPGGSVFCHGNSACSNMKIDNTIGCLICDYKDGNDACSGAKLVADDGTTVDVPTGETYVYQKCKASDIITYLNALHPQDGEECEDSDNNGHCDVVQKYCNGKNDNHCIVEFKRSPNGSWIKADIPDYVRAVDPDSLSSPNDSNDDGRQSLIAGIVVIAVFLLVMVSVVVYCGQKNQWSWWKKNVCGEKHDDVDGDVPIPSNKENENSEEDTAEQDV